MTGMTVQQPVEIPVTGRGVVRGDLAVPAGALGLVVFAHGSGSSRHSSRNRQVAGDLRRRGIGTFLMDLLTEDEEQVDLRTRHLRFDIGLLAERLVLAADQVREGLPLGYFGASTGAAAALVAAARQPDGVKAVVSRGGRPDLAGDALAQVRVPTLLIVGGRDDVVIGLNQQAQRELRCRSDLVVVPGATHLFEEPGALERVSELAGDWFSAYLP
jgi:putative phosphoribosyl transferase